MEETGNNEPPTPAQQDNGPTGSTSKLEVAMQQLRTSESSTSMDSNVTQVIVPTGPLYMSQKMMEDFQAFMASKEAKRKRKPSGPGQPAKKQRPSLTKEIDDIYKRARNAMGRQAKFHAQMLGLRKYNSFGDHLVTPPNQVSLCVISPLHLFSPPTGVKTNLFFSTLSLTTIDLHSLYFVSLQVKNVVPAGITDEAYLKNHREATKQCEKRLLAAELDYAERMYNQNTAAVNAALNELKAKLGADSTEYKDCLAAANTCADIHRKAEHQKQTKYWSLALSQNEATGLGITGRKKTQQTQKKRPVAQQPQTEPAAGPSGIQERDNRTFVRARRRLVPNNGNNAQRGRQRNNQRDNSPDARTMAQAMKIAKLLQKD